MESPETLRFASKEECILVFLATGGKTSIGIDIQGAFISWEQLPSSEKLRIDRHMQQTLDPPHKMLYEAMIRSFNIWNQTQDTDGAPGWRIKESSVADVVKYIGCDLTRVLNLMEEAWQTTLRNPADHYGVKRVESLLKLPDLASVERDLEEASEEVGWVSGRNDDISADDLKKICQIMGSDLQAKNGSESDKDKVRVNHPSCERLEDIFEAPPPSASSPSSLDNLSLEEETHIQDLLIDDKNNDSDFEKQISPILSIDDQE